jgi:nickel/cobalt exporter
MDRLRQRSTPRSSVLDRAPVRSTAPRRRVGLPLRLVAAVAFLATSLIVPAAASAHPLGNFTVNHYARIEPAADRVRVVYVLDMAEIPAFQEQPRITPDPDAYATQRAEALLQNLHLTLNGTATALRLEQRNLTFPPGAGNLPTLRLEATYAADLNGINASTPVDLTFRDDNDPTRIGWREVIARPTPSTNLTGSSVAQQDTTDELRHYPEDLLNSPLNVREARLTFVPAPAATQALEATSRGTATQPLLPASGVAVLDRTRTAFADLANGAELTPSFILFAIGVALVLGMAHALQPGHGKTVVAAYLFGSRGTARHALFLGATVTATHTAGVYALGVVTLFLSQYILPERLYPVLEVASGLLVVAIGIWLFGQRALTALGLRHAHNATQADDHAYAAPAHRHTHAPSDHAHHDHSADHGHTHAAAHHQPAADHPDADAGLHSHGGGQPHSHTMPERVTWKSLLALGVSGGLLPCPEALMVLLITIAAHRVLFGLLLIVSFSTGLAAVLVGFGLLLVYARGLFSRVNLSSGLLPRLLPVASALVIVIAGGVITAQALPQVL